MQVAEGPDLLLWTVVGLAPLVTVMAWLLAVRLWGQPRRLLRMNARFNQPIDRGPQDAMPLPAADALAGLACDPTLDAAMAHAWRRFGQWQRPVALLELSIDQLALLRAQFGERQADAVVAGLSWQLKRALRAGDVLAHAGDGVFRILLPDTPAATAQALAQRLLQTVGTDASVHPEAGQRLRLSAGLAHAVGSDRSAGALSLRAGAQRLCAQRAGGDQLLADALLPEAWPASSMPAVAR